MKTSLRSLQKVPQLCKTPHCMRPPQVFSPSMSQTEGTGECQARDSRRAPPAPRVPAETLGVDSPQLSPGGAAPRPSRFTDPEQQVAPGLRGCSPPGRAGTARAGPGRAGPGRAGQRRRLPARRGRTHPAPPGRLSAAARAGAAWPPSRPGSSRGPATRTCSWCGRPARGPGAAWRRGRGRRGAAPRLRPQRPPPHRSHGAAILAPSRDPAALPAAPSRLASPAAGGARPVEASGRLAGKGPWGEGGGMGSEVVCSNRAPLTAITL